MISCLLISFFPCCHPWFHFGQSISLVVNCNPLWAKRIFCNSESWMRLLDLTHSSLGMPLHVAFPAELVTFWRMFIVLPYSRLKNCFSDLWESFISVSSYLLFIFNISSSYNFGFENLNLNHDLYMMITIIGYGLYPMKPFLVIVTLIEFHGAYYLLKNILPFQHVLH